MNTMDTLEELQKKVKYHFQDIMRLKNAITHSSYANEKNWDYNKHNERLEFLGDAILELVVSEYLFKNYPDVREGELTKLRASLVCEQSLAFSARELDLTEYLFLGRGEKQSGGGKRDSILSDAFEAIVGAIYLDGGLIHAKEFIEYYVLSDIEKKQLFSDSKSILQEIVQSESEKKILYQVEKESGPDHNKVYECSCSIGNKKYATGKGKSKKIAEQAAAYETILLLRERT